jgi:glycosyltransferase involved in cell wall biosynthesis
MNRLLIIGHQFPEPLSSAAGWRMLQIIQMLQEMNFEIHFACAAKQGEFAYDLSSKGVIVEEVQMNDSRFDDYIKELNPKVVLFDRFMVEEQFGWRVETQCPNALRILDTEDLHFLRQARAIAVKAGRSLSEVDLRSELAKREIASIYRSDLSLIISSAEMDVLQASFDIKSEILHYLPFLTDKSMSLKSRNFEERKHFVSIGNFLHEPNWDAVQQLKYHIWPMIRKKLPKAELHVFGAYPSEKVLQLMDESNGFIIKGRAEDAREVIAKARVLLAPIRFGAGLKGKLFEAMLCGTPSVTTDLGAEGLQNGLAWNGHVANDNDAFAAAAIQLYSNKESWEHAQSKSKDLLDQFALAQYHTDFKSRIEDTMNNLLHHRNANFIGGMLRHHAHRSTEFMSRWIEEKNRVKTGE